MVYDHYHFIEFVVVNSCQPPLMFMSHCFTANSGSVNSGPVNSVHKGKTLQFTHSFIPCLGLSAEKSVHLREGSCMNKHESQDEF